MKDKLNFVLNRKKFNIDSEKENQQQYNIIFSLSVVNKKIFDNLIIINHLCFSENLQIKDDEIISICPNKGNSDDPFQVRAPTTTGKKYVAQTLKLSGSKNEIIKTLKGLLTYFTENYNEAVKNLEPLSTKEEEPKEPEPNVFTGTQDQSAMENPESEVPEEGPGFD